MIISLFGLNGTHELGYRTAYYLGDKFDGRWFDGLTELPVEQAVPVIERRAREAGVAVKYRDTLGVTEHCRLWNATHLQYVDEVEVMFTNFDKDSIVDICFGSNISRDARAWVYNVNFKQAVALVQDFERSNNWTALSCSESATNMFNPKNMRKA